MDIINITRRGPVKQNDFAKSCGELGGGGYTTSQNL